MHQVTVRPGVVMAYEDHYFGKPWLTPEPIVLVHGIAESSRAWTGWVPNLAGTFRVLRPDLPGFGASPVPVGYDWRVQPLAAEIGHFLDALGIGQAHIVAAKYGGSVALKFACDQPSRVSSLSIVGSPVRAHAGHDKANLATVPMMMEQLGIEGWAAKTQRIRLGSHVSQAQIDWWTTKLMGLSSSVACHAASSAVGELDLEPELGQITAPTLVLTTVESGLQTVETVRRYTARIPNSRMEVLDGDCYHVAAAKPDECAARVMAFISSLRAAA